ncbi:MAG: hypothetical protein KC502_17310 [Myxococcales bacterium]|nr:hypothetical protein [Myxococcales bacterium]
MKKSVVSLACLVLGLLLVATSAQAKDYPHKPAGVTISIPGTWKVDGDDTTLSCVNKDESVGMFFAAVSGQKVEEAAREMKKVVTSAVKKLKMGKETEEKINGMPALIVDGKGVVEGKRVDVSAMLIHTPTGKFVLSFAIGKTGKWEKHTREVMGILKSLRPLKSAKKARKRGKK